MRSRIVSIGLILTVLILAFGQLQAQTLVITGIANFQNGVYFLIVKPEALNAKTCGYKVIKLK